MDKFTKAEIDTFLEWAAFSCSPLINTHENDASFTKTVNETALDIVGGYQGPDIYKGVDELFYINYNISSDKEIGFSEFSTRSDITKMFIVDINFFFSASSKRNLKILSNTVTYH